MVIIIDCGHNYSDTWQKMSPIREDGSRFYEYENNRKIGRLLSMELDKLGIPYVYTIHPDDRNDKSLENRVGVANSIAYKEGKDNVLFISIHSDAYGMGDKWYDDIIGFSIFTSKGETKSDIYGNIFEKNYKEGLDGISRVRGCYDKNFYVLKHTICPAILLENGFYTSHKDLEFIDSEDGRKKIVDIIVKSIQEIIKGANQ
jgi:N-acetylmuramoyl-L-alanine amidase